MAETNTKKQEITALCGLARTHLGHCEDWQKNHGSSVRVGHLMAAIERLIEAVEQLGVSPTEGSSNG